MIRLLTLTIAIAAFSLTSCASMKKDGDSCCATTSKKECCSKAEAAGKKCDVCDKGKAHKH